MEMGKISSEKHEYYNGTIVFMAVASEAHNRIVGNIIGELYVAIKGRGCTTYPSDMGVCTPYSQASFTPILLSFVAILLMTTPMVSTP